MSDQPNRRHERFGRRHVPGGEAFNQAPDDDEQYQRNSFYGSRPGMYHDSELFFRHRVIV